MPETTSVIFSGPILSFMALESFVTSHSEGYLIGRVTVRSITTITDSEGERQESHTVISISQFVPAAVIEKVCSSQESFQFDEIENLRAQHPFGEQQLKIVGWFRSRRNSSLVPSFREHVAHRRLVEAQARIRTEKRTSNNEPFVFVLLVHAKASVDTQHALDYAAFTMTRRAARNMNNGRPADELLKVVDMRIANLGDAPQSVYRAASTFHADMTGFASIAAATRAEPTSDVSLVTDVHRDAQTCLAALSADMVQATLRRLALREEIYRLERERTALGHASVESDGSLGDLPCSSETLNSLSKLSLNANSKSDPSKRESCNLISFGDDECEHGALHDSISTEKEWVNVDSGSLGFPQTTNAAPPNYSLLDSIDIAENWQQVRVGVNTYTDGLNVTSQAPPPYVANIPPQDFAPFSNNLLAASADAFVAPQRQLNALATDRQREVDPTLYHYTAPR